LREKSFELCQTQQRSLSLHFSFFLLLLNSTEIEKKEKEKVINRRWVCGNEKTIEEDTASSFFFIK